MKMLKPAFRDDLQGGQSERGNTSRGGLAQHEAFHACLNCGIECASCGVVSVSSAALAREMVEITMCTPSRA